MAYMGITANNPYATVQMKSILGIETKLVNLKVGQGPIK